MFKKKYYIDILLNYLKTFIHYLKNQWNKNDKNTIKWLKL